MFRRFSANFAVVSILVDALSVGVALVLAVELRPGLSSLSFVREIILPVEIPTILYLVFPLMWVGILLLFGLYDGRRNLRFFDEWANLTLGSVLAGVSLAGVLYFSFRDISRFLFLFFVLLGFGMMLTTRILVRIAWRFKWLGRIRNRRVLILGAGDIGHRFEAQIQQQAGIGLALVGYLDDNPKKQAEDKDVIGGLNQIREVVRSQWVEDVVVALPLSAYERLNWVVGELHDLPVRVWVIPDYFSLTLHKASVEELAGIPMLDLRAPALSEYQRMVKRAFDLGVTLVGMLFALPLMGVIALAIRIDSPGTIFYRPKRVGENGRMFDMIKFRTMVQNADQIRHNVEKVDQTGAVIHKSPDDPRITRVGRFLRRTSLDEIPQLLNVLRGEMSLVGPRPEQPFLVEKYATWQRTRFAVPQGMTGWWQINGRSDKPMHLHTEDDLYYVQHYSIWLDLRIIFRTIWVVLRGKGAY